MITQHSPFHREQELPHGKLHVFADDEVYSQLDAKVFTMADNNLRIPRNVYMSYTPDAHVGIGTCIGTTAVWNWKDGFVSPSIVGSDIGCGMRLHLTGLQAEDLKGSAAKRELVATVERHVPVNERSTSRYRDIRLEEVVKDGLNGLPAAYLIDPQSSKKRVLTHVEHARFRYDASFLERIPDKMWKRGWGQLGTLGGGNHFIEFQRVEVSERKREIATRWGLFDGQIVVMIHSGSRAWGGMIGPRFVKDCKKAMERWGVGTPDPNLVYAPIDSEEGQQYINLMYSALNFAVANRHMIAYGVGRALADFTGSNESMPVLYDLMHNYALQELHRKRSMLVHRKGTTRALPPGHPLNPNPYRETGHPALIPGSMGTSSYIMVGEKGGKKNFYSICHGAGRVRSRRATREQVSVDAFSQSMKVGSDEEIVVNQRTLASILDECPQAYKDVDAVIRSVEGAGLASVVARCHPVAVLKGV